MGARELGQPNYRVVVEKDVAIRTRDGLTLRSDVYRPEASGKFPVLVVRSPDDKNGILTRKLNSFIMVCQSGQLRASASPARARTADRDGTCA